MGWDEDRIDRAVLALLQLTPHDGNPAWKGRDWDVPECLHAKGLIYDPVGKAKSAVLTAEGLFTDLFSKNAGQLRPAMTELAGLLRLPIAYPA